MLAKRVTRSLLATSVHRVRERIIGELVQGDRIAWALVGVLWLVATAAALVHRPGVSAGPSARVGGDRQTPASGARWVWVLLALATVVSLAGVPLAHAIAIPRLRWSPSESADLVATSAEGWRKLRSPAVFLDGTELAVPTIDAAGRWVLVGLLSNAPVPGMPPAEPGPIKPAGGRVCAAETEECRPWPPAWPDPKKPIALGEFAWTPAGDPADGPPISAALAYDVESSHYLRFVRPAPDAASDAQVLELVGRLGAEAPHDDGAIMFVLRRFAGGRLRAARLLASPRPEGGHTYALQRLDVSLTAGRRALRVVEPLLWVTSFSLPVGILAFLLASLIRRDEAPGDASARLGRLEAAATFLLGIAVAAPAAVALATLWGSR